MSDDSVKEDRVRRYNPELLNIAKAQFLCRHALTTLLYSLLIAYTVLPLFYNVAHHGRLYGWLSGFTLIMIARYLGARYYLPRAGDAGKARQAINMFTVYTFVSGLLWGLGGLIFIPFSQLPADAQLLYISLYAVYCCALSAGGMANHAVHKPLWYAFAVPCMLPLMLLLLASADLTRHILCLFMLIYFIFLTRNMLSINETIIESLVFRLDKDDLMHYLNQEQERIYQLNRKLQVDIDKRIKTEEALRKAKTEAEELAAELLTLSSQDSLTGISNRRSFDDFLQNEWNRAIRQQRSISLILGDIDYYKAYNDIFGHQKGDECLINIARLLQDFSRRSGEMAARYGGEEFVIVLADTGPGRAEKMAEQLRQAILALAIEHPGSSVSQYLTMSFGVSSTIPTVNMERTDLIQVADQALYEAKSNGRNNVVAKMVTTQWLREKRAIYQALAKINDRILIL